MKAAARSQPFVSCSSRVRTRRLGHEPDWHQLEELSLAWLQDLFGLPPEWDGVLTTGATTANFAALAAARQWWGEQQGVDVAANGLAGLPEMPVASDLAASASAV